MVDGVGMRTTVKLSVTSTPDYPINRHNPSGNRAAFSLSLSPSDAFLRSSCCSCGCCPRRSFFRSSRMNSVIEGNRRRRRFCSCCWMKWRRAPDETDDALGSTRFSRTHPFLFRDLLCIYVQLISRGDERSRSSTARATSTTTPKKKREKRRKKNPFLAKYNTDPATGVLMDSIPTPLLSKSARTQGILNNV